jgi:hypothetical protein
VALWQLFSYSQRSGHTTSPLSPIPAVLLSTITSTTVDNEKKEKKNGTAQ